MRLLRISAVALFLASVFTVAHANVVPTATGTTTTDPSTEFLPTPLCPTYPCPVG